MNNNNNKDNRIRVWVTKDLEIDLNFVDKEIDIVSSLWTVKVLKSLVDSTVTYRSKVEDLKKTENKPTEPLPQQQQQEQEEKEKENQIQPSAEDLKLQKFIAIFESLAQQSPMETVPARKFKVELIAKGLIQSKEFNNLLNDALAKDLIAETEQTGYYILKKS